MKLLVITQRVDEDHPALGATVPKLRALAARVDELVVLALSATPAELPPNVRVRTFGGRTRLGRTARLLVMLVQERPSAVLAHMSPVYAVLASPWARLRRVPLLLWFTHWRVSRTLRLAHRLSTTVLSVDRRSFPVPSTKLVAVGHGIEVGPPTARRVDDGVLRLLALGRTSPAKGLETILEAVRRVPDAALVICGPALTEEEQRHRETLIAAGAHVVDPVPHSAIAGLFAESDVLVNNMRAGALDKVVFEAAAAGLPVLVASAGFDALVQGIAPPLRFAQDDVESLAAAIHALHEAGPERRHAIGDELRERVRAAHSVEHWADAVLGVLR